MIKNTPSYNDYKEVAIECLIQSFYNISEIDNHLTSRTPREKLWEYNQIVLRTSIVLIHQGIEGLMKAEICQKSPLLLLNNKRSEWNSLPNSADQDFSELYTIAGEDLLKTFYACINEKSINPNFLGLYEEIRTKRNKIIHGLGAEKLNPDTILKYILNSFTYLLGKDSFWQSVLIKFYKHPGFEHDDDQVDWEEKIQYNKIEYLNFFLGKAELNKHFSVDIKARAYLCPYCTENGELYTNSGVNRPTSKWAFLHPNKPNSKVVACIVCQAEYEVIREDCTQENCKGNVKYLLQKGDEDEPNIWVCLTCWNEEDKKICG